MSDTPDPDAVADTSTPAAETPVETAAAEAEICPCGSEKAYAECCGAIHSGTPAETAEALMRARYTAYAKGHVDFIRDSMHPDVQRREFDRESVEKWANESDWLGLQVLNTTKGGPDDQVGTVEFIAQYGDRKNTFNHHETAEFRKHDGKWYFYNGRMMNEPYRREEPKIGRNEPCPCGSGKKYKKCCGR